VKNNLKTQTVSTNKKGRERINEFKSGKCIPLAWQVDGRN